MIGPSDAEKLWNYFAKKEFDLARRVIENLQEEKSKEVLETEVNVIVFWKNNRDSLTPVHVAAKRGYYDMLEAMFKVAEELNPNVASSLLGWSPLHYAIFGGHVRAVKALLKQGAKVNHKAKDGQTPLHIAISRGYKKMATLLMQNSADVNAQDESGNTVLHYCVDDRMYNDTAWTEEDRRDIVGYLTSKGATPGLKNNMGNTVLHVAVRYNVAPDTLRVLLSARDGRGSANVTNTMGQTPLHICNTREQMEILLQNEAADVNKQTNAGKSALHQHTNKPLVTSLLLDKGADPTLIDRRHEMPLHVALTQDVPSIDVIDQLLDVSDVDAQNVSGNSGLHIFCENPAEKYIALEKSNALKQHPVVQKNNDVILGLLLSRTSNANVQNGNGETPLHCALRNKQYVKARMLLDHGCDLDIPDVDGRTARHLDLKWLKKIKVTAAVEPTKPLPKHSSVKHDRVAAAKRAREARNHGSNDSLVHLPRISNNGTSPVAKNSRPSTFPPVKQNSTSPLPAVATTRENSRTKFVSLPRLNATNHLGGYRPLRHVKMLVTPPRIPHQAEENHPPSISLLPNWLNFAKEESVIRPTSPRTKDSTPPPKDYVPFDYDRPPGGSSMRTQMGDRGSGSINGHMTRSPTSGDNSPSVYGSRPSPGDSPTSLLTGSLSSNGFSQGSSIPPTPPATPPRRNQVPPIDQHNLYGTRPGANASQKPAKKRFLSPSKQVIPFDYNRNKPLSPLLSGIETPLHRDSRSTPEPDPTPMVSKPPRLDFLEHFLQQSEEPPSARKPYHDDLPDLNGSRSSHSNPYFASNGWMTRERAFFQESGNAPNNTGHFLDRYLDTE